MKTLKQLFQIILFIIIFIASMYYLGIFYRNLYIYFPAEELKDNDKNYKIIARGIVCVSGWASSECECEGKIQYNKKDCDKYIDKNIFIYKIDKKSSKLFFEAIYKYPYHMIVLSEPTQTIKGYYDIKAKKIIVTYSSAYINIMHYQM